MTPEQLASAIAVLSVEDLRKLGEVATRAFSQKAEGIYDKDPENNGRDAQTFADAAMLFEGLAQLGLEPDGPLDVEDDLVVGNSLPESSEPTTVSQAVAARATKNPWSGR